MNAKIPFNKPLISGKELDYIRQVINSKNLSGNGIFTKKCNTWLEQNIGCRKALLTHSCTGALEMAAILCDIQPGDEIIMPSYTFVSTANAFVLRGGIPVFVDIRSDTLNLDESLIEEAISTKTKAIVPVHYAGVPCEMNKIMAIASKYNLLVVEDAAQGLLSSYENKPLGSMGQLTTLSFHETKNIISGEGGALLINEEKFIERAEIIWEKGTNRHQFFRGEVDKYTWVDIGSSFLPSDLIAAFLYAQLEKAEFINGQKKLLWNYYHAAFSDLEKKGIIRRPDIPINVEHNAHLYYLLLPSLKCRDNLIKYLKNSHINAVFHYVPLHSSPAGKKYSRTHGQLTVTDDIANRLLRLPLFPTLNYKNCDQIIDLITNFFH